MCNEEVKTPKPEKKMQENEEQESFELSKLLKVYIAYKQSASPTEQEMKDKIRLAINNKKLVYDKLLYPGEEKDASE